MLQILDDGCQQEAESKRRKLLRKRITVRNKRSVIYTPPHVRGRKHENVQTEKYLEDMFIQQPESDAHSQTDLFLQRSSSIPVKAGIDAITEILEGELFDFDKELQPIIETLVGRAVDQGFIEVMHEEELADLRKQQQEFLAKHEYELVELGRSGLEEQLILDTEKVNKIKSCPLFYS